MPSSTGQSELNPSRESNRKGSSGKGTRRINIRYFFVTIRISNEEEVRIDYCLTGEILNAQSSLISSSTACRTPD